MITRDMTIEDVIRKYPETVEVFRKFGLDHCVIRTDRPYVVPLRDLFARRARRLRR